MSSLSEKPVSKRSPMTSTCCMILCLDSADSDSQVGGTLSLARDIQMWSGESRSGRGDGMWGTGGHGRHADVTGGGSTGVLMIDQVQDTKWRTVRWR